MKDGQAISKVQKSKLHIDKLIYKEVNYTVQRLIKEKKKNVSSKKLEEDISEPKELWKTSKNLSFLNKSFFNEYLPKRKSQCFSVLFPLLTTKEFFSNLTQNVVKTLPTGPNKSMAMNVVSKVNTHLKFLYQKNKLLWPQLR